jgi:multiple sugar transport system substrate-binding protein
VWYHEGRASERATLVEQVERFNARQDSVYVSLRFLPEGSYEAMVQASAVAGQLPDLLDLDGPYVTSFAWQRRIRPVGALLTDSLQADLLPSIVRQGTFRGELYGVGTFDSGLGLYASRSALDAVGARIPGGPEDAWSVGEFDDILARLADRDGDGAVLDLKLNNTGEWFTYAFQPVLRSAGGGLVTGEPPRASGVLDGPESIRALRTLQSWIEDGLVDPNLDDAAFVDRRVAISWSGHWDYPRYAEALGADLAVLPLPDFGEGTRTGQGSWVWTVPRASKHPALAASFLSFLLEPDEVLAMARANGGVPGTRSAASRSDLYGPAGPLALFLRQLVGGYAVPRPRTPAYPVLSSLFQEAFGRIRDGDAVDAVLHATARAADREIADNEGYPAP